MRPLAPALCCLLVLQTAAPAAVLRVSPALPRVATSAPAYSAALAAPAASVSALAASPAVSISVAPAVAAAAAAPAAEAPGQAPSAEAAAVQAAQLFENAASRPEPAPVEPGLGAPVKTFTLPNGLKVVVQTDKTSPVVAVSLTYKVGALDERPGLAGFAHLFEHLMFQGTKNLKPGEFSRLVAKQGGLDNAYTTKTNTTYHLLTPKGGLRTALWAMADQMSTLNIDARALAVEQSVVINEIRPSPASPYNKALSDDLGKLAYEKWENQHSVGGDARDIAQAKLEDVRAFYKAHYAPNNAVLALVGDVTEAEARELAGSYFGPIAARPIPARPDVSEPPIRGERRAQVRERFAQLGLVSSAWRAPERGTKDYLALRVLNAALMSGDESPLYRALVKEEKAALQVEASMPWSQADHDTIGAELFNVLAMLKPGVSAERALRLIDGVLAKLAEKPLETQALEAAKTSIESSWWNALQDMENRAKMLSSYTALIGEPSGLARELKALLSITAQDVKDAVSRWLVGKGRAVLEVVPDESAPLPPEQAPPPIPEERPRAPGEAPPAAGAPVATPIPSIQRFLLSNGLEVLFARDARLPLLEARLIFPAGSLSPAAGEELARQAASELLLQGADGRGAAELSARFSRMGWKLGAKSGSESTVLSASGLARSAGDFFAELSRVLRSPDYPESELALWRENSIAAAAVQRDKPQFMAMERLQAELFPGHPFGEPTPGDEKIAAVTRDQVKLAQAAVMRPSGATLVIAGDADPRVLRAQLESALGSWSGLAGRTVVPALPASRPEAVSLVERPGSSNVTLVIGQAASIAPGDQDYAALRVLSYLLGGSATSRLFEELREKRGYTYTPFSRLTPFNSSVLWTAGADVRSDVAAPALAVLRAEIARLRAQAVSAEELDSAKRVLSGLFARGLASAEGTAGAIAEWEARGRIPETELAKHEARLEALTPEELLRVAQKYLDPARMATVAVGDPAALAPLRPQPAS